MREIAILACAGFQPLDVVGPFDVFAAANAALRDSGSRRPGYAVHVVGARPGPVLAEGGLQLVPHKSLVQVARARGLGLDTLIVAGGGGARRAADDDRLVRVLTRVARQARRVTSVCTGAFLLAATGLLDGRRATTHWAFCTQLARRWPAVQVEPDPIFVRDGRIWTSAGVTAGIDLSLALVEEDLGPDIASAVARTLVVFVRRAGGQSQFSAQLAAQAATRAPIRAIQGWVVEHPESPLAVPDLARRAGMSVRHFSRVFRTEVGVGPAGYVENVRVETARRLLETTELSVEEVAAQAGFGTPESLRRTLHRRLGLAPREYRSRFAQSPAKQKRGVHAA